MMINFKNGIFPSVENNEFKDILNIAFKMMAKQPQERLSLQNAFD